MNTHTTANRPTRLIGGATQLIQKYGQPVLMVITLLWVNRTLFTNGFVAEHLMFQPDALAGGQWWRLLTYPLVHLSIYHLLLDAGAFLILLHGLNEKRLGPRLFYCLCASTGSLLLSWFWSPQMAKFGLAGLSGLAHGLLAISALELMRIPNMRRWGALSLGVVVLKSGYELVTGTVVFDFMHLGLCGTPIAASHAGGVIGALMGFSAWRCLSAAVTATLWPLLHKVLRLLIHGLYRVQRHNLNCIPSKGAAVLVSNHVSYIDALILIAVCQRPIRFVMHTKFYHLPVLGWLFKVAGAIPIDSAKRNPALLRQALGQVSAALDRGELVGLFPEGRLTRTGHMSEFRPGIEKIIQRNPVPVVPLALRGLWGSFFSHYRQGACNPPRRKRSLIEVTAGGLVPPSQASAPVLYERVATLRANHL